MNKTLTDEQRSAVEVALSLIGLSADPRVAKACKGLRSLLATQQPEPRAEVTLTRKQITALDVAINCLRDRPDPLGIREDARDTLLDLLTAHHPTKNAESVSERLDAERYRWLKKNCFDWAAPGDGDSFDFISLHFEHELLGRDDSTVDAAIDAARAGGA